MTAAITNEMIVNVAGDNNNGSQFLTFTLAGESYGVDILRVQEIKGWAAGNRVIGLVVDNVSDVINVSPEDIKPTPNFGTSVNTEFLNGLATSQDVSTAIAQ